MTADSKPNTPQTDADNSDRCLLYLLGEMNEEQTAAFEAELGRSAALQTELIPQAECLVRLSNVQPSVVVTPTTASFAAMRLVMTVAATAACLLFAFLSWPSGQARQNRGTVDSDPEFLLIAKAWAEESLAGTSITDLAANAAFESIDPGESFVGDVDEDASLSWLVPAVEAGAISDG